ncbi:unnamed protein product [Sphagnum troendelagicum]|uniref:Uncharacterized protein n=1 Tax=Sphagnum troendelagicum TaxID=128251 RepID=A0ABP0URQ4_9BRYO
MPHQYLSSMGTHAGNYHWLSLLQSHKCGCILEVYSFASVFVSGHAVAVGLFKWGQDFEAHVSNELLLVSFNQFTLKKYHD